MKFEWSELCQSSFDSVKQALIFTPVLVYPNTEKPFILTCDASDYAIGYTLSQLDNYIKEHVIAYGGKSLTRKKMVHNRQGVLRSIERYRTLSYLSCKYQIYSCDRPQIACWLNTAKHNGRLEIWSLRLQEYNFEIIHRPGKSNVVADALSRRQYEETDTTHVCKVKLDSNEDMKENPEMAMVTLYYKQEPVYEVSAPNADMLQTTVVDSETLSKLQGECPDFSDIMKYLKDQTFLKKRNFMMSLFLNQNTLVW